MDTRAARRAAEKVARDLLNSRAAVVGDLAVAHADRARLADEVEAASKRGRDLVAAAEAEAARLLAAAQDEVGNGERRYADLYGAATAAGWTAADLAALGFPAGTAAGAKRRRATAAEQIAGQPDQKQPAPEQPTTGYQAEGLCSAATAPALPRQSTCQAEDTVNLTG